MTDLMSVIDDEAVRLHGLWLEGEPDGKRLVVAGTVEITANLRGADLSGADLYGADLRGADLRGANLRGADLSGADLSGADLRWADLRGANLRGADLRWANLSVADLRGADLSRANLSGADLRWADLRGANLRGAKNIPDYVEAMTSILPDGTLTVYKKAYTASGSVLLTLEIPADAQRSNAAGRKCRASKAILRAVEGIGWEYDGSPVRSGYDTEFVYPAVGETIMPDKFDPDRWDECSYGIHFFITRYEALNY